MKEVDSVLKTVHNAKVDTMKIPEDKSRRNVLLLLDIITIAPGKKQVKIQETGYYYADQKRAGDRLLWISKLQGIADRI